MKEQKRDMPFFCILAFSLVLSGPSARVVLSSQDPATTSSGSAQDNSPAVPVPAQPPPPETSSQGSPAAAKPPEEKQKGEGVKVHGAKKTAAASGRRQRGKQKVEAQEGEPRKVVVRHGGALEPTARIVPGMPREDAIRQRQIAVEMLVSAEQNLKLLSDKSLGSPQQETVTQIRDYIEKAKAALTDGDTPRAYTLSLKAHLLAEDLVKH